MHLRRQSRLLAAIVMLVSMFAMQLAIASCRCLESELAQLSIGASMDDDHGGQARGHHAHGNPDTIHGNGDEPLHADGQSCDDCPDSVHLSKRFVNVIAHPDVAPFVPSALVRVLIPAPIVWPRSTAPRAGVPIHATAPPVYIRDCTFQL